MKVFILIFNFKAPVELDYILHIQKYRMMRLKNSFIIRNLCVLTFSGWELENPRRHLSAA